MLRESNCIETLGRYVRTDLKYISGRLVEIASKTRCILLPLPDNRKYDKILWTSRTYHGRM